MDTSPLDKKDSLELVRELLIAISYCVPDKDTKDATVVTKADRTDEFRSKLISISYLQSLDNIGTVCNGHA